MIFTTTTLIQLQKTNMISYFRKIVTHQT